MREAVRSGTARMLQDLPVPAAAKTGTAEIDDKKATNVLFTAFAPYDNPEVAITVLVERATSSQGYAMAAAHEFLQWYFTRTLSVP